MTIDELIAALEKAEGPSRDLDQSIIAALYPRAQFRTDAGYRDPIVFHAETLVVQKATLPRYTSSLDAALTLAPDGWRIAEMKDGIRHDVGEYCHVSLWCPANARLGFNYLGHGATPAIALCIAALKARRNA